MLIEEADCNGPSDYLGPRAVLGYRSAPGVLAVLAQVPIEEPKCKDIGGTWKTYTHNIAPPECKVTSRRCCEGAAGTGPACSLLAGGRRWRAAGRAVAAR